MQVTPQTRLNMVIGYPLTHTQSPLLHATVYQLLGIDAVLLAQPHLRLKSLIHAIKTLSVGLTAVTLPYKEKVLAYLDECSDEVNTLQAANTLIARNGKLHGYNTDVDGIAFALRDITIQHKRVLVLGAGGAARAMGYFLQKHHASICWLNRTPEKALTLATMFGGNVINHHEVTSMQFDIIVNTTPIGLYPNLNESPLPPGVFHENQVVFDMIYHPMLTTFLKQAQQHRATIISGLEMFIGQGLKQIELFTHQPIPTSSLLAPLREILIKHQRVT